MYDKLYKKDLVVIEGSGCFLKDTKVKTTSGYKLIQDIVIGDIVHCYGRDGNITTSTVEETYTHTIEEIDDLYSFKVRVKDSIYTLPTVTANHALYDIATNEHLEARYFVIGDELQGDNGEIATIVSIEITHKHLLPSDLIVYNFEVEKYHTYLVGSNNFWLKVHNGGSGKGAAAPIEDVNTLRSEAVVNVLEIISEGQIVGLENGSQSVYLNQVRVTNTDGTDNYSGVTVEQRYGLPSQTPIEGFDEIATTFPSGTSVTQASPVTQDVIGNNIHAVMVTLSFPQGLSTYLDNGNLTGYEVDFKIEVRQLTPTLGTLQPLQAPIPTLKGKSVSAYEVNYRVPKPDGATKWQFVITRISPDDPDSKKRSMFTFSRWVELFIPSTAYSYDDIALIGLSVPARVVGNQIPARGYFVTGRTVRIPDNYNPSTREYFGTWLGGFQAAEQWTDNTAWILYDLLTHPRYGIGTFMNSPIKVDKFEFYKAAVHNDELVPDGVGGFTPRYRFNGVLQQRDNAWQVIQAVASNMRAVVITLADGTISLLQERPTTPVKILTNANVIDGMFTYSSPEVVERITSVNVTFNDRLDRYLPRTISYPEVPTTEEQANIDKYGLNVLDKVAVGVVDEGDAVRFAKWLLYPQGDLVSFTLGLNIVGIEVGQVVSIMDNDYIATNNSTYLAGRIKSVSGTTVVLDRQVDLTETGYTFGLMTIDYLSMDTSNTVTNSGITDTLTLATPLPVGDYVDHEFFIYKVGIIEPRQFRIVGISETSEGLYEVAGYFYDPNKWDIIELGLQITPPDYARRSPLAPVKNLIVQEDSLNDDNILTNLIRVSWDFNPQHRQFDVAISFNGDKAEKYTISETFFEAKNILVGTYEISVTAYGMYNDASNPTTITYVYGNGDSPLAPPINFQVQGGGSVFNDKVVALEFTYNPVNLDFPGYLKDYIISAYQADGTTFVASSPIPYDHDTTSPFYRGYEGVYSKEMILSNFGSLPRNFWLKVHARDTINRLSPTSTDLNVTNPAPASPSGTITGFGRNIVFTLTSGSVVNDAENLIVAASTTSGFNHLDVTTWQWKGLATSALLGTSVPIADVGTYYIRLAISDSYSDTELNWTVEYTVVVADNTALVVYPTPSTPTGLSAVVTHIIDQDGVVNRSLVVSWNAVTIDDVSSYTVGWKESSTATYLTLDTTDTNINVPNLPSNKSYDIRVRANFVTSNSPWSAVVTINTGQDVTPTSPSTYLNVTNGSSRIGIDWNLPIERDYKHTEIWLSTVDSSFANAAHARTVSGDSYLSDELPAGLSGWFWVRHADMSGNLSEYYPLSTAAGVQGTTAGVGVDQLDPTAAQPYQAGTPDGDGVSGNWGLYPIDIAITGIGNNLRDITLTWQQYVQGTLPAQQLALYYYEIGTDSAVGSVSGVPVGNAPYVPFLLNFDGGNFLLEEASNTQLTLQGLPGGNNPTQVAGGIGDAIKFVQTDASTKQWASMPIPANMDIGTTGDFTFECLIKVNSYGLTNQYAFKLLRNNFNISSTGVSDFLGMQYGTLTTGTWYHLVAVRKNGKMASGKDGVITYSNWPNSWNYTSNLVELGGYTSANANFNIMFKGEISYIRVSRNYALFDPTLPSGTTYQVPTSAPTLEVNPPTQTSLLLHFDGYNGGTTFTDSSNNGLDATVLYGNPTTSTNQVKYGTTSLYINNPNDLGCRIQTPSSALLQAPAGTAFTLDFWINVEEYKFQTTYIIQMSGVLIDIGNNSIRIYTNTTRVIAAPAINTWGYVRIVRDTSDLITVSFNGSQVLSFNDYQNVGGQITIGSQNALAIASNYYLDSLRFIKGEALQNDTFVPPSTAPTASVPPPITFRPVEFTDNVIFLPTTATSYTLPSVIMDSNYRFGISAVRTAADGTVYATQIVQPIDPEVPDWSVSSGEITSGEPITSTQDLINDVDQLLLDFNNTNNTNYTAVIPPTLNNNATDITHVLSPDGLTVRFTLNWNYNVADEADIDGFIIVGYGSTSNIAYTFGSDLAGETTVQQTADKRSYTTALMPANLYYSMAVVAYRKVNPEPTLAPNGALNSPYIQSTDPNNTPYQATANLALDPTIDLGQVDGTGTTTVTMDLTTKPGTSTAPNTWISINSGGKKYWVPAWEDVV